MPTRRFQVSMAGDTTFPRDRVVNTLYFHTDTVASGGVDDVQKLADDLAAIYNDFWCGAGTREINVKAYNIGPPPQYPIAEKTLNVGATPGSNIPRELAICLSFYADRNVKRRRGRIYLPVFTCNAAGPQAGLMQARPNVTLRERVLVMADQFSALGGLNVDWQVYSEIDKTGRKVTRAWVDDEWDAQRRRGLRASTRNERAVSG